MVAHRQLIWALVYFSLIYRNNVVYCANGGAGQQSRGSSGGSAGTGARGAGQSAGGGTQAGKPAGQQARTAGGTAQSGPTSGSASAPKPGAQGGSTGSVQATQQGGGKPAGGQSRPASSTTANQQAGQTAGQQAGQARTGTAAQGGTAGGQQARTASTPANQASAQGGTAGGQAARTGTGQPAKEQPKSGGQGGTALTPTKTLKLLIKDPSDESKTVELDPSELTPTDPNDLKFVSHKFDDKTKATEVKYKKDSVWKFNTKTNVHPISVAWHESYKLVLLQFEDSYWFFTKLMNEDNWRSRGLGNSKHLEQNKIKLYAKEGSNLRELGSDKYAFKDLGFGFEYVFHENTKCEKLAYDSAPIFMHDTNVYDGGYPKVLYVFGDRSGQVFFEKSSYPLRSPLSVVVNLKDDKAGTNKYEYSKVDKLVTYTAKQGYGFGAFTTKVKGDGCCSCCNSKNKISYIWNAKDGTEYATKIVLEGKGKSDKMVTIHLANNTQKVFKKDGKTWTEVAQNPQAQQTTAK